jgi:hypothetical protein
MSQTLEPALGEATVQELREAVRGQVLTPGEDGYAEARPIWNGMHEGRRPGLIVRYFGKKLADKGKPRGKWHKRDGCKSVDPLWQSTERK